MSAGECLVAEPADMRHGRADSLSTLNVSVVACTSVHREHIEDKAGRSVGAGVVAGPDLVARRVLLLSDGDGLAAEGGGRSRGDQRTDADGVADTVVDGRSG